MQLTLSDVGSYFIVHCTWKKKLHQLCLSQFRSELQKIVIISGIPYIYGRAIKCNKPYLVLTNICSYGSLHLEKSFINCVNVSFSVTTLGHWVEL